MKYENWKVECCIRCRYLRLARKTSTTPFWKSAASYWKYNPSPHPPGTMSATTATQPPRSKQIIHTNGCKDDVLFNTEKKVNDIAFMSRKSFTYPNLKYDLRRVIMRPSRTIREICDFGVVNSTTTSSPVIHVVIVHKF